MSLLNVRHLEKSFGEKKVLSDICLEVEKGDIYGVLGLSGAGKATLVRCLNGLEEFDSGEVYFKDQLLISPKHPIERKERRKIAMIFQSFNLLEQRNALGNVKLALEVNPDFCKKKAKQIHLEYSTRMCKASESEKKTLKKEEQERVAHLKEDIAREALKRVGLADKEKAYPSELSGGQKQRIAIARALVLEPEILLSDEATSALDPETTSSILALLKQLNKELGLTILMISHQMNVIEEACNKVAIIDSSRIVENGPIQEVYLSPKTEISRKLLYANHVNTPLDDEKQIRLLFNGNSDEPILANIVQDCQILVSVVYADTKVLDGKVFGQLVLKMPKNDAEIQKLESYLFIHHIDFEEVKSYDGK